MKISEINTVTKHLESYGIRPSVQRIAIMSYLLANRTHPTVDEIYSSLLPTMPTLSRTTVYNTVKYLVERGACLHIGIDEQSARYDGYPHAHSHFQCKECKKVFDLPAAPVALEQFEGLDAFEVHTVSLYFKGICPECITKQAEV
jgi:Fur family transcriptional regulator, peroxide stress response regulator